MFNKRDQASEKQKRATAIENVMMDDDDDDDDEAENYISAGSDRSSVRPVIEKPVRNSMLSDAYIDEMRQDYSIVQ